MKYLLIILLSISSLFATKIELEVLGSGGPELDGRASTSYILWIDNKARLLVDMGSGSMLRFEQSGAKLKDLEAVVLTHLHIDHAVDLPSYVKAGFFTSRYKKLDIIGPKGNNSFPSIDEYLVGLFGENGIYRYMRDVLNEDNDSFQIKAIPIENEKTLKYKSFSLKLITVHHGMVPALALRIDIDGKSIVISGDTNNQDNTLEDLAKDTNLFIAHHAIPKDSGKFARALHMNPSMIAKIAKDANVKKIILTHRMNRTLNHEKESLEIINKEFQGEVIFAEDRMKIEVK